MEETTLLLMEKNLSTGHLEREVGSYTVSENGELISNIFLSKEDNKEVIHLKVTTEKDIEDDKFDAVYDSYDMESLKEISISVDEVEEEYNPTWEITFEFDNNIDVFQNKLQEILNKHKEILERAYNSVK
ncbi:DUF6762 family protein [Haloimpatiens sp. FM7315]|uniref:DUF6762 family protein n=1 Tax=Haloimpatiens sp. FM7315 TaxID=3298609 RepID=UPI0035A27959